MHLASRSLLAAMLAVTSVLSWSGPGTAQTAPEMDCIWKGTCSNQPSKAQEEQRRRAEEERRRKADEDRRRASEEDQRRKADEDRRRAEEDQRRKTDEDRRRAAEEDQRRKADEDRRRAEEDQRRKTDEDRRRVEEDQRRKADEDRRRVEEERRRLDEDQRKTADRKRQEGELLAALRRGDPNDVLLFVNETTDAPNASRIMQGPVSFRDSQAAVCSVVPWTGGPEVGAAVQAVLARHGATRILTNVAQTACPDTRRPFDVIAVERRVFQDPSATSLRSLVTDIIERRLTPLEPGVTAADIAAARERVRPSTAERRRLLAPKVNPLGERLVAELQAYIAADGKAGTIGSEFVAFASWHDQVKGASRTLAVDRFEIDDYGDATGASGSLPAAAVVVYFNVTASGRPAPDSDCMVFAWLDDSAAAVRREPIAFRCDALSEIDQWKRQRGLRSKWT